MVENKVSFSDPKPFYSLTAFSIAVDYATVGY
jgi:hypothetical protein